MNLITRIKGRIYRLSHPPYGEILGLHRVADEKSPLEVNRELEITPAFLEQTILQYKSAGYCFVSLDEVQRQVESRRRGKHKFVCFTLDDGYADNYERAYPVFKKHNCPFAIYVITNFPDKKAWLWWYYLQDILLESENLRLDGMVYDCSNLAKKDQAFRAIRKKLLTQNAETTRKALERLFQENASIIRHDANTLSWEQICELASDPLCTIGAHTVSHPSLPGLSDEQIRKELSEGKEKIESRINKQVKHFAYPYGDWDDRVAALVMEQYDTAVLAWGGLVRKGDTVDRLKRNILFEKT